MPALLLPALLLFLTIAPAFMVAAGAYSLTGLTPAAAVNHHQRVNINRAGQHELASKLTGIGMKSAGAIVLFRMANGPFKSVDELLLVKGIGPGILRRNQSRIVLE